MKIKILQLNMFKGRYIDTMLDYIKKEDFDILQLQEVAGPGASYNDIDCFKTLQNHLDLDGELATCLKMQDHENAYFGNATFYRKTFRMVRSECIWLKPYMEVNSEVRIEDHPRCALHLEIEIKGKTVHFINCHLAWGPKPNDEEYKLNQAKILVDYVKKLNGPFVLTGDFNVTPNSQIVKWFDELGRNLVAENNITNTLNSRTHRAKEELFPPGLAVDFIYASKDIHTHSFHVLDDLDLSDHLGLTAEVEI